MARDIIFARYFGAGMATDAFFVASKIPNYLRRLFAEGAFSQGFIPVLSEYKEKRDKQAVRELIAYVIGTLGTVLLLVTCVGLLVLPLLFEWAGLLWFEGVEQQKYLLASDLILWTFPYIFFVSITALVAGVLNTYRYFALPAFTPVLLNLILIGMVLGFAYTFENPITSAAVGMFIAGIVQLLFLLPTLKRIGFLVIPLWGWSQRGVKRIIDLMVPAIFGASIVQINLMIDIMLAFFLASGSVSWLYYADRLVEFPLGVFGIALSTVILPVLSQHHAADSPEEFSQLLDWGVRWAVLVSIPATVGLLVLAEPLITTLFAYEAFTVDDIYMSSIALVAYAFGLPAFILAKILAPGFFARQDTKTPVKAAIASMITNVTLNFIFVGGLLWASFSGPHMGLALATSIGAYVNAILLFYWLRSDGVYCPQEHWLKFMMTIVLASIVMGSALWFFVGDTQLWYERQFIERVSWLLFWVVSGALLFGIVVWSLGLRLGSMKQPKHS